MSKLYSEINVFNVAISDSQPQSKSSLIKRIFEQQKDLIKGGRGQNARVGCALLGMGFFIRNKVNPQPRRVEVLPAS